MKCKRCNKLLKNHADNGLGPVCKLKAAPGDGTDTPKTKVELVSNNNRGNRNYLVTINGKRAFASINFKQPRCLCTSGRYSYDCEHIAPMVAADREKFPEDYPQAVAPVAPAPVLDLASARRRAEVRRDVSTVADRCEAMIDNLLAA